MYCKTYVVIFQCLEMILLPLNQNMIKLSLIKQILNVNDLIIETSSPKLMMFRFFEVIKCNSEAPLLLCFSSFVTNMRLKQTLCITLDLILRKQQEYIEYSPLVNILQGSGAPPPLWQKISSWTENG